MEPAPSTPKRRPLAYAASVTEGLRRAVDGDKAYSGLITKNPLHEGWAATATCSIPPAHGPTARSTTTGATRSAWATRSTPTP